MLIWKGCGRRGASEEAGSNAFVRFGLFYNVFILLQLEGPIISAAKSFDFLNHLARLVNHPPLPVGILHLHQALGE